MKIERKFALGSLVQDEALGDRQIRVIASTPTPDRAGDVMVPRGCEAKGYQANPIILADHDPRCPIGKATLEIADDHVGALIEFAPAGVSAKADEYCGLAKAGILNTVSIGFKPIEAQPIKGAGYRYTKWELMEISIVAVPANPEAIVVNRSLDQSAKADAVWKCGASRNLPIGPDEAWDSEAAAKSVFDHCGFGGDKPDLAFARKAFLAYDSANPGEKSSYQESFATVIDGRLTAMPAGLRAAASRLPAAEMPGVKAKARAVLDEYEAKVKASIAAAPVVKTGFVVKDLWDVSLLAELLMRLGWAHSSAAWEAEFEGDGSKVPGMLAEALRQLAAAFEAMAAEEVAELLAGRGLEVAEEGAEAAEASAAAPKVKVWRALRAKAGRVLSQANQDLVDKVSKCLNKMADCHVKAADSHDDANSALAEMRGHLDEATKSLKGIGKKKPSPSEGDNSSDGGDGETDDADTESDEPNVELSAAVARRKREIEIVRLSSAP